ncbi:MAG: hypothetical protein CK425_00145 [Parachlamydia sp.]|nr:MAG: hypothetical protein CK425_00145 [Parachlamydia sp.]
MQSLTQATPPLYAIPDRLFPIADAMPKIVDYLGPKDKAITSLVCRYFKDIAEDWIYKFETSSGIPQVDVKPFLMESLRVFPELAETDFTLYVTVQEFFKSNTHKTVARLDVSLQSDLLVLEILKGLAYKNEPVDSFNLYAAISTNNLLLLRTLLETLKEIALFNPCLVKKYHEEKERPLEFTDFNEIIRFTIKKGSLDALRLVIPKISSYRQNLSDVIDLLKEESSPQNFAKLDFMADFTDQLLYHESNPISRDFKCSEEKPPFKFTFGELLKSIARQNHKAVKVLMTKVRVTPIHCYCARLLGGTHIRNMLSHN